MKFVRVTDSEYNGGLAGLSARVVHRDPSSPFPNGRLVVNEDDARTQGVGPFWGHLDTEPVPNLGPADDEGVPKDEMALAKRLATRHAQRTPRKRK